MALNQTLCPEYVGEFLAVVAEALEKERSFFTPILNLPRELREDGLRFARAEGLVKEAHGPRGQVICLTEKGSNVLSDYLHHGGDSAV